MKISEQNLKMCRFGCILTRLVKWEICRNGITIGMMKILSTGTNLISSVFTRAIPLTRFLHPNWPMHVVRHSKLKEMKLLVGRKVGVLISGHDWEMETMLIKCIVSCLNMWSQKAMIHSTLREEVHILT